MDSEDDLLNLLLKSPNSVRVQAIAENLEIDHNFFYIKDRNYLQDAWELRRGSSNSLFFFNIRLLLITFKFLIPLI